MQVIVIGGERFVHLRLGDWERKPLQRSLASDERSLASDEGTVNTFMTLAGSVDPVATLLTLLHPLDVSRDRVEDLGEEEISGVRTRHHRLVLTGTDIRNATSGLPSPPTSDIVEELLDNTTISVELWLGFGNFPYRLQSTFSSTLPSAGLTTEIITTLDARPEGAPFDIRAPI